jgi:prolyl-tRNA editing enzyme YbaK/EbsC (Cys-tRNA(Pro) deacylase)
MAETILGSEFRRKANFRVAPESVCISLTGFAYNAVTPLGLQGKIPVVLDAAICSLPYFWLGAGEVDLKWAVPTQEFIRAFKPIVGKVSN